MQEHKKKKGILVTKKIKTNQSTEEDYNSYDLHMKTSTKTFHKIQYATT